MKLLRKIGLGVAVVGLIIIVLASGLHRGWFVERQSSIKIAEILKPHLQIFAADPDAPLALLFHGCGHDGDQQVYWGQKLQAAGITAVVVDSYTGRGITTPEKILRVCRGRDLWGAQRAGDVVVALDLVKQLGYTSDNVTLIGWSHGGWSIMDAFAFNPPQAWPIGLADSPKLSMASVDQVVLFYPYCGFGTRTSRAGWQLQPDVLALLVETDRVVGKTACPEMLAHLSASGQQVTTHIYSGVDHAFDVEVVTSSRDWPKVSDPVAAKIALEDALERVANFINPST